MSLDHLISECTAYDFKVSLEVKRPKSWLKSVSAFANGNGGSLFFGINDEGQIIGLPDMQLTGETISAKIRDYIDPLPDTEMIPHRIENMNVLQLKVQAGSYTPYYYVGDGQRIAFIRVGDESIPATSEQMVRLILKGSNKTFDSLDTSYKVQNCSYTLLANAFRTRTGQDWENKFLQSFGLVSSDGTLSNAGALFADDCPLIQSRLYCTRWDGNEKGDAINDVEFSGNVLVLLREAMNFVKSNTRSGWKKLSGGRKNRFDYSERAIFEAIVNHIVHRDYTVIGGEVHIDIYDNRICLTSPGGMYNGLFIQDLDLAEVSSDRRNPVLANVMSQLNYMEKRGSGLTRICKETIAIEGYSETLRPQFKSSPAQFITTIFAVRAELNVGENVGENVGVKSEMEIVELSDRQKNILKVIQSNASASAKEMSEILSVSSRTIERDLSYLKAIGKLRREGVDKKGLWVIN